MWTGPVQRTENAVLLPSSCRCPSRRRPRGRRKWRSPDAVVTVLQWWLRAARCVPELLLAVWQHRVRSRAHRYARLGVGDGPAPQSVLANGGVRVLGLHARFHCPASCRYDLTQSGDVELAIGLLWRGALGTVKQQSALKRVGRPQQQDVQAVVQRSVEHSGLDEREQPA